MHLPERQEPGMARAMPGGQQQGRAFACATGFSLFVVRSRRRDQTRAKMEAGAPAVSEGKTRDGSIWPSLRAENRMRDARQRK